MNKLKEKKLNNKGFSLVELIIVIAIMAVLIGVLAPQYLKYVERSRVSTDKDNIAAMESAIQVYGADTEIAAANALKSGTIKLTRGADPTISDASLTSALTNAGLDTKYRLQNRQTKDPVTITVTVETNGTVKVSNDWNTPAPAPAP